MNWFLKKMIIATTSIITLSVGSLTAHAQQLWIGRGVIIEGENKGASVLLKIETDDSDHATILSEPETEKDQKIRLLEPTETSVGTWKIYPCNKDMCVTFEEKSSSRIIYYRLRKQ